MRVNLHQRHVGRMTHAAFPFPFNTLHHKSNFNAATAFFLFVLLVRFGVMRAGSILIHCEDDAAGDLALLHALVDVLEVREVLELVVALDLSAGSEGHGLDRVLTVPTKHTT